MDAPTRSRSVEITGALPPTAAPKSSPTRFSAASAERLSPCDATSSLLAVINFFPRRERAGRDRSRRLVAADCLDDHVSVMREKRIEAVR